MRVAVFNGPGRPISIDEVEDPRAGPGEVVVGVCRCGLCGSDLSMTEEGPFCWPAGAHLGHEYAGEVVEVGRGVTELRVGDRVACNPLIGCGQCEVCRSGYTLRCPNRTAAMGTFGGFGDYKAFPAFGAVRLPDSLSFADGALVEPIACGLHALRQAHWRGDERLLVLGSGTMAAAVVYWARALGAAKIVVASRSDHAHEMMMTLGADAVHSFQAEDEAALAEKLGGPPDMVAECVGKVGMIGQAIQRVRQGGTVVSLGMCAHDEPINGMYSGFKEVTLTFPVGYTFDAFVETTRAFDGGHVKPDLIVGEVIPLEQFPELFESLRHRSQSWKVHVDPRLRPDDGR